jgi:hypothetical protein
MVVTQMVDIQILIDFHQFQLTNINNNNNQIVESHLNNNIINKSLNITL